VSFAVGARPVITGKKIVVARAAEHDVVA